MRNEVLKILAYDPETGVFTWRRSMRGVKAGPAGCKDPRGYVVITVLGKRTWAHRLAFLVMTGSMPESDVDHINGDRADNRWSNLRAATRAQNLANTELRVNNTSGHKGVTWNEKLGKWQARIRADGKRIYLGSFGVLEEAGAAYRVAAKQIHQEFSK